MGIGASIFLMAVGAILAFAVHASLGFVSIQVVGWVLMAAGLFGLLLALYFWNSRRRTVVRRREVPAREVPAREVRVPEQRVVEREETELNDPYRY